MFKPEFRDMAHQAAFPCQSVLACLTGVHSGATFAQFAAVWTQMLPESKIGMAMEPVFAVPGHGPAPAGAPYPPAHYHYPADASGNIREGPD